MVFPLRAVERGDAGVVSVFVIGEDIAGHGAVRLLHDVALEQRDLIRRLRSRLCGGLGGRLRRRLGGRLDGVHRLYQRAIEEGDDLRAGAGLLRAEMRRVRAVRDAVFIRPEDGLIGIMRRVLHIGKGRSGSLGRGASLGAPEERGHLLARAGQRRAEMRRVRAGGDLLAGGPDGGVVEIIRRQDVHKGVRDEHLFRTEGAPQERDDLITRAGLIRAEGAVRRALGDDGVVLERPVHGLKIIRAGLQIGEVRAGDAKRQQGEHHAQRQQRCDPFLFHAVLLSVVVVTVLLYQISGNM